MAAPTVAAFTARQMHNIAAIFDAGGVNIDFGAAIQSIAINSNAPVSTVTGGKRSAVFSDAAAATWQCTIKFLQDIEKLASFLQYLFNNQGNTVTLDVQPHSGMVVRVNVILVPPSILGDVNDWEVSTVTLGVVGTPTFTGQS